MKFRRYKIPCTTEATDVYTWREESEGAPTACPNDTAHTIDTDNILVVETVDSSIQKTDEVATQAGQTRKPWGLKFTATKNTTTVHYEQIPYNCSLRGAEVLTKDAEFGDTLKVEVEDKDGIVYPAGTVLDGFADTYNIWPDKIQKEIDETITEALPSVFYMKVSYTSVGTVDDVKVGMNFLGYEPKP